MDTKVCSDDFPVTKISCFGQPLYFAVKVNGLDLVVFFLLVPCSCDFSVSFFVLVVKIGPKEIGVGQEFLDWLVDPILGGGGASFDFGCYGANLFTWVGLVLCKHFVTCVVCVEMSIQRHNDAGPPVLPPWNQCLDVVPTKMAGV